jgi:hypothetical protein
LITPSSIASNPGGASKVCGAVTYFQPASGGVPGSITLGGVAIPIAETLFIPGQNKIAIGANVCISPLVLINGQISGGSSVTVGNSGCLQFSAPLVFSVLSGGASAGVFNVNPATFSYPAIYGTAPQGLVAMARNTTVRAVSCTDSFWDLIFEIGAKGETEGDMVTIFVQNPNGTNIQILGMFTIQNGGVMLNQLHPGITMLVNGNGRSAPVISFPC